MPKKQPDNLIIKMWSGCLYMGRIEMTKTPVSVKNKRRIAIGFVILAILMMLLAFRVAWIQIVQAEELTEKAIAQQTSDIPIEAKRGNIYDRNAGDAGCAPCPAPAPGINPPHGWCRAHQKTRGS